MESTGWNACTYVMRSRGGRLLLHEFFSGKVSIAMHRGFLCKTKKMETFLDLCSFIKFLYQKIRLQKHLDMKF